MRGGIFLKRNFLVFCEFNMFLRGWGAFYLLLF